jgi:hypothetical protein
MALHYVKKWPLLRSFKIVGWCGGWRNRRICVAGRHYARSGSFYYHVGSYVCSGGKWKGELTIREHTLAEITRAFAGHVVSMGFNGTYTTDYDAEFDATPLVGKRRQIGVIFRLLIPD